MVPKNLWNKRSSCINANENFSEQLFVTRFLFQEHPLLPPLQAYICSENLRMLIIEGSSVRMRFCRADYLHASLSSFTSAQTGYPLAEEIPPVSAAVWILLSNGCICVDAVAVEPNVFLSSCFDLSIKVIWAGAEQKVHSVWMLSASKKIVDISIVKIIQQWCLSETLRIVDVYYNIYVKR